MRRNRAMERLVPYPYPHLHLHPYRLLRSGGLGPTGQCVQPHATAGNSSASESVLLAQCAKAVAMKNNRAPPAPVPSPNGNNGASGPRAAQLVAMVSVFEEDLVLLALLYYAMVLTSNEKTAAKR